MAVLLKRAGACSRQPTDQMIERLAMLGQVMDRAVERTRLGQRFNALAALLDKPGCPVVKSIEQRLYVHLDITSLRHGNLSRHRGRCGALIGHKVSNGNVRFVAHGANEGNLGGRDGAGHDLLIECPQVFRRPAAAAYD
jgi:hypothetical protein